MKAYHKSTVTKPILVLFLIAVFSQHSYGLWDDCWDNPRQCHGDADGLKAGPFWVSSSDAAILQACFPLPVYCGDARYNPCADFNRDCVINDFDVSIIENWINQLNVPADCSGKLSMDSMSGEILLAGSSYTITWDDLSGYCNEGDLYYSTDNGNNWNPIDPNLVDGCSCNWIVPDVNSEQCLLEISYIGHHPIVYWEFTDTTGPFTIYQCQLTTESDYNSDCYIDLYDFAILASDWLKDGGTDMNDLSELAQRWGDCGNPYDPACGN